MTKQFRLTWGLIALAIATVAQAQAPPNTPPSAKLEVTLSKFQGELRISSQPFYFRLPLNEKGSLKVDASPQSSVGATPVPCSVPSTQFVGTQVDGAVRPIADGQFSIEIRLTERAVAGCRDVGGISVPVFSNIIIERTVVLKSGDHARLDLRDDKTRNESDKVDVSLTIN